MEKDIEGFLSNPFFVALEPNEKEVDSNSIKYVLDEAKKYGGDKYYPISDEILEVYKKYYPYERSFLSEDYERIVNETILEYLLKEDGLQYFVEDNEDIVKCSNLFNRKQFNSKLIKKVLNRICYFLFFYLDRNNKNYNNLSLILIQRIRDRLEEFNNAYILEQFGPLKKIVDKVVSGVKNECYLQFEKGFMVIRYLEEKPQTQLYKYVFEKYGYRYKYNLGFGRGNGNSMFYNESDDKVLSLAIINDEKFWDFSYSSSKTFLSFVFLVEKYNGFTHAKKLIDYAFNQVQKNPICAYLIEKKLHLYLSVEPEKKMLNWCITRLENKLNGAIPCKIDPCDYNGFLYPRYNGFEECVKKGKEIFENFIKIAYKEEADKILEMFLNLDLIIQDPDEINSNLENQTLKTRVTFKTMLEAEYFGYNENSTLQQFMYGYYSDFGLSESILGRMYYKCFIIEKLTNSMVNDYLYEIFFDIFSMIEKKYGIKCYKTINNPLREQNYSTLKVILNKYGFGLEESYKTNYIAALLDRKYASLEETKMFSQLEQLGDAIYELAADNILFYNPEPNLFNHQNRESLVKAETQIKISQKLGLDKLYISDLHEAILKTKFLDYERSEMGLSVNHDGNFIADSLEMIIGALSIEFGVQRALDFSTKIILESNEDLIAPQFEKFDILALNKKIENTPTPEEELRYYRDYYSKIFPAPFDFDNCEYDHREEYKMLWIALRKILLIQSMNNDSKEKRIFISDSFAHLNETYYQCVASYLYNGIEKTIEQYKTIIESYYSKNIAK